MRKKTPTKGYHFSESVLKEKATAVYKSLLRDSRFFAGAGFNKSSFRNFSNLLKDFESLQNGARLDQMLAEAEMARDEFYRKLCSSIEEIRKIAQTRWGLESDHYKKFAFQNLSLLNDEQLLESGISVVRTAQAQKQDLIKCGLTAIIINRLLVTCTQFEDSIESINEVSRLKEKSSADHLRMSNQLFKQLIEFCNAGKQLWMSKDPQRYRDYVL